MRAPPKPEAAAKAVKVKVKGAIVAGLRGKRKHDEATGGVAWEMVAKDHVAVVDQIKGIEDVERIVAGKRVVVAVMWTAKTRVQETM